MELVQSNQAEEIKVSVLNSDQLRKAGAYNGRKCEYGSKILFVLADF